MTAKLATTLVAALLAAPSFGQPVQKVATQAEASADAPRVATLMVERMGVPKASGVERARRPAQNPKLAAVSCEQLTVAPGAVGALVFEDGFENGSPGAWNAGPNSSFSIRGALDLEFTAHLQGFGGEALLRVELTSPRGHHFQTLEAPVVEASGANQLGGVAQTRTLDGYPHPVPVRFAQPQDSGDLAVSLSWPLAGTHVVSHGLYGDWTVDASLVDATSPAADLSVQCPTTHFSLQP